MLPSSPEAQEYMDVQIASEELEIQHNKIPFLIF
jgi:hypothetical protein